MSIAELIALCERRLVHLGSVRSSHAALGDVEQVEALDEKIAQTTATLAALRTLE